MTIYDDAFEEIMRLSSAGEYAAAMQLCNQHLQDWPPSKHDEALHSLAYVQSRAGDLTGAFVTISKAIDLAPETADHRRARASWALQLKHYDAAVADASVLLDLEKARASIVYKNTALVIRSFALSKLGKSADALRDLSDVDDEGPFRVCGANWMKSQLVELARSVG
jgi:tetratricopeptide (TPR) repeat protein